jgi:exonuclease III
LLTAAEEEAEAYTAHLRFNIGLLAERLVAAGVDREVRGRDHASDHAPVWIELKD